MYLVSSSLYFTLVKMLFHINSFRQAVYQLPHAEEDFKSSTTLALQSVFKQLQFSKREVSTKVLTVAFGWTSAEAFMQQDVQEMMRVLLDKLEEKMKGTVVDGCIRNLFSGTVRSFIRCVHVNYESKREEDFYDIQLDVKGCKNIIESFKKYTESELLEGENQYDAGAEHGKQDANKGVVFTKFPPVLTIHLKRFEFDMQTFGFTKIHDNFEFPRCMQLDEFLAPECRPTDGNVDHDHDESAMERRVVPSTYHLHSVLVHSGDVGGGHYYAYIRPHLGKGNTYVRNDSVGTAPPSQNSAVPQSDDATGTEPAGGGAAGEVEAAGAGAEFISVGHVDRLVRSTTGDNEEVDWLSAGKHRETVGNNSDHLVRWFKFNDETVLEVKEKEAVEFCYGRKVPDPTAVMNKNAFVHGSYSSAYMLVYLREEEAADIMKKVGPEAIPVDLIKRLDDEVTARRAAKIKEERENMYMKVQIASECDILDFKDFTKQDYLLPQFKNMKQLTVMAQTTFLGLVRNVAKKLNLRPVELRMWGMEYKKGDAVTHQQGHQVKVNKLSTAHQGMILDEQIAVEDWYGQKTSVLNHDSVYFEQLTRLPDLGYNVQRITMGDIQAYNSDFDSKYEELEQREETWLNRLREALYDHTGITYTEEEDPVADCGIGSGNIPLQRFLGSAAPAVAQSLWDELQKLAAEMHQLFIEHMVRYRAVDSLLFVKAFDPLHLLNRKGIDDIHADIRRFDVSALDDVSVHNISDSSNDDSSSSSSSSSSSDESESTGSCDEKDNEKVNDEESDGKKTTTRQPKEKKSNTENQSIDLSNPQVGDASSLKYLGYVPIFETKATGVVMQMISHLLERTNSHAEVVESFKSLGLHHTSFQHSFIDFMELPEEFTQKPFGKTDLIYNASGLYILSQIGHIATPTSTDEPKKEYNFGVDGEGYYRWLQGQVYDRQFFFRPFSARDRELLLKRHHKVSATASAASVCAGAACGEKSDARNENKKRSLKAEEADEKKANALNDAIAEWTCTYMISQNNLNFLEFVAARINIPAQYLSLYIVPRSNNSVAELEAAQDVEPISIRFKSSQAANKERKQWALRTLSQAVAALKYKKRTKFVVLYRIHPFAVQTYYGSPTDKGSLVCTLLGNSLRQWRSQYLARREDHGDRSKDGQAKRMRAADGEEESSNNEAACEENGNGQCIEWPSNKLGSFDSNDGAEVYLQYKRDELVGDIVTKLKRKVGVPLNIDDIMPTQDCFPSDFAAGQEILSDELVNQNILAPCFAQTESSVVSERLVLQSSAEGTRRIDPQYCIALLAIRYKYVSDVISGASLASDANFPDSWLDAQNTLNNLFTLGAQFLSHRDIYFMKGLHPSVKSTIVSVFNFTLLGNKVVRCQADAFCGPFISYVREDDDYFALSARLAAIAGEPPGEFEKVRLAVVNRVRVATFISKPTVRSTTSIAHLQEEQQRQKQQHEEDGQIEESNGKMENVVPASGAAAAAAAASPNPSVWQLIVENYPRYQHLDYQQCRIFNDYQVANQSMPCIGIQRSVSDIKSRYVVF